MTKKRYGWITYVGLAVVFTMMTLAFLSAIGVLAFDFLALLDMPNILIIGLGALVLGFILQLYGPKGDPPR